MHVEAAVVDVVEFVVVDGVVEGDVGDAAAGQEQPHHNSPS